MLKKLGYRADVVANGQEAVEALSRISYDLVLMDCQMPELDGFEATALIRRPASAVLNHNVPVIAMTANAMSGDRERCIRAGMDDYLSKPVKPKQLEQTLDKWLAGDENQRKQASKEDTLLAWQPDQALLPLFDEADLFERLGNNQQLLVEVIGMACTDLPLRLGQLQKNLAADDLGGAKQTAHTIKGIAANLGGCRLQQVAGQLEKQLNSTDRPLIQKLTALVEEQAEALLERLREKTG
jgi:CheY-like chemotaxis protein